MLPFYRHWNYKHVRTFFMHKNLNFEHSFLRLPFSNKSSGVVTKFIVKYCYINKPLNLLGMLQGKIIQLYCVLGAIALSSFHIFLRLLFGFYLILNNILRKKQLFTLFKILSENHFFYEGKLRKTGIFTNF